METKGKMKKCVTCEKQPAEYPKEDPVECAVCFCEGFKGLLECKKQKIELQLSIIKNNPDAFAKRFSLSKAQIFLMDNIKPDSINLREYFSLRWNL